MAKPKRLLVLTRDRTNAAFRQRVEPYLAPLAARGIETQVVEMARSPWERGRQMRGAHDFDGVLLQRKTLALWDTWSLRSSVRRLIYDFDDAVMYQARAPEEPHPGRLRRFCRTVQRADLVIAGNGLLADRARKEGGRHVEVVPTGLDTSRFPVKTAYAVHAPARLVWVGSHSTLKQLAPFHDMFEALGRARRKLVLRVIADAALDVPGLAVENLPWMLQTEARLLAESDVGIAPLPDTPYTRGKCGFKVLQYMAAGLPVITSPVGVNAEYVTPGKTGLWARSPKEWVEAVEHLAADAALCERLGRKGRERAAKEFDFKVLAARVCDLIEQTLA
jgi:glycosyltransferase involved in cell wall biosynthesis